MCPYKRLRNTLKWLTKIIILIIKDEQLPIIFDLYMNISSYLHLHVSVLWEILNLKI